MINKRISIQTEGSDRESHMDTYILGEYLDEKEDWKRPLVLVCPGEHTAFTSNRKQSLWHCSLTVWATTALFSGIPAPRQYFPQPFMRWLHV